MDDDIIVEGTKPQIDIGDVPAGLFSHVDAIDTSALQQPTEEAPQEEDGPTLCPSLTGMTAEEIEQAMIDQVAAQALATILARMETATEPMEYGAFIYYDDFGQLNFTPLLDSPDHTSNLNVDALPRDEHGNPDYSRVVAMIHSHPNQVRFADGTIQTFFGEDKSQWTVGTDYLMTPSVYPDGRVGDWVSFTEIQINIDNAGGDAAGFSQYIAGYNPETGEFELYRYDAEDNNGATTVGDGDQIDPENLGLDCNVDAPDVSMYNDPMGLG